MRRLRLRALVDDYFAVVCALVVLCVVVGGWATYGAYAEEDRRMEERTLASVDVSGQYDHAATVSAENELYPVGTTLEDRPRYFTRISPVLNGTLSLSLATRGEGTVSATAVTERIVRSTGSDGTTYWERSEPIDETRVEDAGSDEEVPIEFAVNVSESQADVAAIEETLDSNPGTPEVVVVTSVDVDGELEGQSVDRSLEYRFTVTYGGGTYQVENTETASETVDLTESESVPVSPGVAEGVVAPAVTIVALAATIGLVVARRRDTFVLDEGERRWLAYRDDRDEFDEWITTFRLPSEVHDRPRAEAETLGDLVDLAIDSDGAVVESPDEGAYYVLSDDLLYEFRPPSDPASVGSTDLESSTATDSIEDLSGSHREEDGDERSVTPGSREHEDENSLRSVETLETAADGLDAPLEVGSLADRGMDLRFEDAEAEHAPGPVSIDEPWATVSTERAGPSETGPDDESPEQATEGGTAEQAAEEGTSGKSGEDGLDDGSGDEDVEEGDATPDESTAVEPERTD